MRRSRATHPHEIEHSPSLETSPTGAPPTISGTRRVAITTNGGALRSREAIAEPFLSTRLGFDLTRTSTFDGPLADALRPRMNVGATNSNPSQPLAAMRSALEGNPGFLRDDAALGIVIITASDDASPGAVSEYASWLQMLKSDPHRIVVSAIHVNPSPRLDSFFTMLPDYQSVAVSLDDADVSAAFTTFESTIRAILPGTCWIASDVDPYTAGSQYDCTIRAAVGAVSTSCAHAPTNATMTRCAGDSFPQEQNAGTTRRGRSSPRSPHITSSRSRRRCTPSASCSILVSDRPGRSSPTPPITGARSAGGGGAASLRSWLRRRVSNPRPGG